MKTNQFTTFFFFFLLVLVGIQPLSAAEENEQGSGGTCTVFASPELYPIAASWAEVFQGLHPGEKISVIKGDGIALKEFASDPGQVGFVSDADRKALGLKPGWQITIGRNIFVAVINSANPLAAEIEKKGVPLDALKSGLEKPGQNIWGTLLKKDDKNPVHFFMINEPGVKSQVMQAFGADPATLQSLQLVPKEDFLSALKNDPYAVGFCKISDITSPDGLEMAENIKLLAIDKNRNGQIDYMEQIYGDMPSFYRGVWIGKYPHAFISNIYGISGGQPANETASAFLTWVLTEGQQYLSGNGYTSLALNESQSQLEKVNPAGAIEEPIAASVAYQKYILYGLGILLIAGLITGIIIQSIRKRQALSQKSGVATDSSFDETKIRVPGGFFFDKTHTWAFMEKDGTVKIGIDDFLRHVTGPISRIDLKNPGERIKKGDPMVTVVQQGKQLVLSAPVSGVIKAHNSSSPFTDGWIYQLEPSNWLREIEFLSMADKYRGWINGEFNRLKDFLAQTLTGPRTEMSYVVLQDGGMLKEGLLADMDPIVWEDFQNKFLDTAK